MGEHEARAAEQSTVIRRVAQLALDRRPDDEILASFLPAYYGELPEFDVDDRREDDLYAVALTHLGLGRRRHAGDTVVEVLSPDRDRDGWQSDRSVVLIISDDAPFMVDTVRIVLERHRIDTHLLVHPMLRVSRDPAGDLTAISLGIGGYGHQLEAWTQVEIDRCDASRAELLSADLAAAIASVHRVVADFDAMRQRMLAHTLLDPLLDWLAQGHFVFLGAATYGLGPDGPTCRPESQLGVLTGQCEIDPDIDSAGPTVAVARSSQISSIHRASRLTVVTFWTSRLEK